MCHVTLATRVNASACVCVRVCVRVRIVNGVDVIQDTGRGVK